MECMVIELKGLTCSNCGAKIENDTKKIKGVKNVDLNLFKQEMKVDFDNNSVSGIFEMVEKITNKYEPDVKVNLKGSDQLSTAKHALHADGHMRERECCRGHHHSHEEEQAVHEHLHGKEHTHEHSHGDENESLKGRLIKYGIGAAFFIAAIATERPEVPYILNAALFMTAYLIFGLDVLVRAVKNISRGQVFDENFLMALSTVGAIAIGEMPEAVFVMLFYQIGETFQDMAVEKSRKSIKSLMDIRPDFANKLIDGEVKTVSPESVTAGDIIIVKPGERIPLDGKVEEGESSVDTSALTGESVPRGIKAGSEVLSGAINLSGMIKVKVTKEFANSTVMKILELTENSASKKTKTEQFITKFARVYTPAVVIAAAVLAFLPPLLIPGAELKVWVSRALVFLVVSCPCALVLSVPLGFFAGIGEASKNGILIKGSNYLQALCAVDTVVMDKTGTITEGVFGVTEIKPSERTDEEELLKLAAYAEKMSTHPIAKSITESYRSKEKIDINNISDYEEISGYGVTASVFGRKILAGNGRLMEKYGVKFEKYAGMGSVVYIADENGYLGRVAVSDKIKEDSAEAISKLKKLGIKNTVILTGDTEENGKIVAEAVGADKIYGGLLPGDKVSKIEEIYNGGYSKNVLFAGDGINDAPVLSRVEVGVAMGGMGSDAAIEAADVVIMNDNLMKLPAAIKIARNTNRIVKENIVFALGVKGIVLVLGAAGIAGMWLAVFADVGVAFIAILNSMRKKA